MYKRLFILILFLFSFIIGCTEDKTPLKFENIPSNLRIINVTEYPSRIDVYGNDIKLIDNLRIDRSSGYLNVNFDSLKIKIFDSNDNISSVYDTLIFLSGNNYYTLILFKKNENISSLLTKDSNIFPVESTGIRIFNNSKAGEPFIFSMRSMTDTISFVSPPLFKLSSYKALLDTSYIPNLKLISNGISVDYKKTSFEKKKHYTIIITDTFIPLDPRYPYFVYLFVDIFESTLKSNS